MWDRLRREYTDRTPKTCKTIDLVESQIPFVKWFAEWLRSFRNGDDSRKRLVLTAGSRRGGKTTIATLAAVCFAIEVPTAITWVVSASFQERDEIEARIFKSIPHGYFIYRGAPKYKYTFPTGSVLRNMSGDDPEVLKQGQVDLIVINEPQKQASGVLTNSLPGIIDRGGLMIMAANPATRHIGEWVNDLKEAIDAESIPSAEFFGFSAKLNESIDQRAKDDVATILRVVDPKAAAADDEGLFLPVGDVAYSAFRRNEHAKPTPSIGDITGSVTSKKTGRAYEYISGADFQATPHHATVQLKVFGGGSEGRPIYWAVGEVIREGTEDDLLDSIDDKILYTPENTVWVGDASGTWQDGAHHTRGRVSFDIFKARRWHIHAPQRKVTDKGDHPKNPAREDRLLLVNKLLSQGRLMVDPTACPQLAIALKKCQQKHGGPVGRYAHITDALGYALWWLEPKPKPAQSSGARSWSVPRARRNSDF